MNRPPWRSVVLAAGLVGGLTLGLVYAWLINPVRLTNTYPPLLRADYRLNYVRLAALSYAVDGDLPRARTRLDGLGAEDRSTAIQTLIEECAQVGRSADTLRRLAVLAKALDVHTPAMLIYESTLARPELPTRVPSPVSTIAPSAAPGPTATPYVPVVTPDPTRVPAGPPAFQLAEKVLLCIPGQPPRIEVVVRDQTGEELSGIELWLSWPGGSDRAITGLKPDRGRGYADFTMHAGLSHSLSAGVWGTPLAGDLQLVACPAGEGQEAPLGSWRLVVERVSGPGE